MKSLTLTLTALLLIACSAVWWLHRDRGTTLAQLTIAQDAALAAAFEASAARADVIRVIDWVDRVTVIHETTAAIRKDVPRYVTPEIDRLYPLSTAFVRVHDAAAGGLPLSPGAEGVDAGASKLAASRAADAIVANYGACLENAEDMRSLQQFLIDHGLAERPP